MKMQMYVSIILTLMTVAVMACGCSSDVLWNDKCPYSYAEDQKSGEQLKKEIPDHHSDFRLQLEWKEGETIAEPNEQQEKELSLTRKILSEVFKPGIIPKEFTNDKFLLLRDVNFRNGKGEALIVKFKTDKYIMKIMKTKGWTGTIYITVRRVDGKTIDDIVKFSEEIFTHRILPAKWEKPFCYANLSRENKEMLRGPWLARDIWKMDSTGKKIMDSRVAHLPVRDGPVGEGLYREVYFYTNSQFAMFRISGGPKMQDREYRESSTSEVEQ